MQILCALEAASWELRVRLADGLEVKLTGDENQICVLPPGATHALRWKTTAGLIILRATIDWANRAAVAFPLTTAVDSLADYTQGDPLIGGLIAGFAEPCQSPRAQNGAHMLALGNLLAIHLLRVKAAQMARESVAVQTETILGPETRGRVFDFIERNLASPITIPELAAVARLSVSHFSTVFKATTGLTPEHFILQRRLWRARKLIETGTRTIGEIAHATGFADHSHLSVQFKRLFGAPPRAYLPALRRL